MKTLKAFGKSVFFWFTSYVVIYLCFSIVTAIMAAHTGMDYLSLMTSTIPLYCLVSTVVASIGTYLFAKEIGLIQQNVITDNDNYDYTLLEKEQRNEKQPFS